MKTVNALETSNLKELSEKNFVQVEPLIEHFLPGRGTLCRYRNQVLEL